MVVTAKKILEQLHEGNITISPFDEARLDVNSYSFRLGHTLIEYENNIVDSSVPPQEHHITIPEQGYLLKPEQFYLASTLEKMGSRTCASELYANFSTAACGIFIQTSAPLGHTGAVINWTLEIVVAQPVIVYPGMNIGKICFWENFGELSSYQGRYSDSDNVVASRLYQDFNSSGIKQ
ncbi:dCTP deaminase domain-containing protein [Erwinia sp. BNK-24-b]|uniref:dCTP deaminase n=1 Tax=unclassified Erwinia TaxID=2622719 RepID=UPI0039BFEAB8